MSLALSPSGTSVYALSDGSRIAQLSMASAAMTATIDVTSAGSPMALMRVAAA
jgi:hypothetical protein